MAKSFKPKKSKKESKAAVMEKLKDLQTALEEGVKNFSYSPEHFKAILEMKALMPSYSIRNVIVAKSQMPEAFFLAPFDKWKKLGRNVKKGARAIRIFAPVFGKKKTDEKMDCTEEETELKGFYPVPVFDVSQTEGDPLPIDRIKIQLEGDCPEAHAIIEKVHAIADCQIAYGDTDGAMGYYDQVSHKIVVSYNVSTNQKAKTLVHEYVHSQVHRLGNKSSAKEREVVAEGTAFVICSYFGLDTSSYSFRYVKSWSDGDENALITYGTQIFDISKKIIDQFEALEIKQEVEAA